MPWGEFSTLTLLKTPGLEGCLEVTGPFNPNITGQQQQIGAALIAFLIIQNDGNGNPTVIVDDAARWEYAPPDSQGKYPDWKKTIDVVKVRAAGPLGLQPGKVRAIGAVVQVIDYKPDDARVPPGVSTFTWCVDQTVIQGT